MWPFERPLSYIRALANVPDHAQKVRAATETGDFLKAGSEDYSRSPHWKPILE
jgi:NifU-like protein involved in Fe-S cluster formation